MNPKEFFIEKLDVAYGFGREGFSILELGSGRSKYFEPLLNRYPNLTYVGVEPDTGHAEAAQKTFTRFPNVTIRNSLAYDSISGAPFDLVLSLSVLEHVKQLPRFIENSVRMTKQGGHVVHAYDLGHALNPSSLKERLQVFLGNHFPALLPEHKFVRYVDVEYVERLLNENGARVERVTYHQMPNHKYFLKHFTANSPEKEKYARDILEWEFAVSPTLKDMDTQTREKLFPTIAIWAVKE